MRMASVFCFILTLEQACFFNLLFKEAHWLTEQESKECTDKKTDCKVNKEFAEAYPIVIAVCTANTFSECVDNECVRKIRVYHSEELRCYIYRECTAAAAKLNYEHNNSDSLADIAPSGNKRIDEKCEYKRSTQTRKNKHHRMIALYF